MGATSTTEHRLSLSPKNRSAFYSTLRAYQKAERWGRCSSCRRSNQPRVKVGRRLICHACHNIGLLLALNMVPAGEAADAKAQIFLRAGTPTPPPP